MKRLASGLVIVSLLCVSCTPARREVTADVVDDPFSGYNAALCVEATVIRVAWVPAYEQVRGQDPSDTVIVSLEGEVRARIGDRVRIVVERRRPSPGTEHGTPFAVAQAVSISDVDVGGGDASACEGNVGLVTDANDEFWADGP